MPGLELLSVFPFVLICRFLLGRFNQACLASPPASCKSCQSLPLLIHVVSFCLINSGPWQWPHPVMKHQWGIWCLFRLFMMFCEVMIAEYKVSLSLSLSPSQSSCLLFATLYFAPKMWSVASLAEINPSSAQLAWGFNLGSEPQLAVMWCPSACDLGC